MAEIHIDHDQGGHAHLQTFLNTVRGAGDNVIFIHGGSALAPGILSSIDKGSHMVSILNDLSPDVMAVSKSDLTHQEDALSLRAFEASFPIINCNIFDPLTGGGLEGLLPRFITRAGDYNIGFVSVVNPEVIEDYMPQRITTVDVNRAVVENVDQLKTQGADIIILIADMSIDYFNNHFDNPPVDIVLLSQSSGKTDLTQQGNSLFELTGHKGMASIITLTMSRDENKTGWTSSSKLVQLSDYEPDVAVDHKINSYLTQVSAILDRVIGVTRIAFDTRRGAIRTGENGFANLTADAIRSFYNSDIGLINAGGFRANKIYASGSNLTSGDIQKELPFNNRVVNLKVTGQILKNSIETGLSRIKEQKGCFPHISGIIVEYNPNNLPGRRIVSIAINGHPLELQKSYTLTTIDFLADGGDGYSELKKAERIINIGDPQLLWEYVRNFIAEKGSIAPEIDGRMKVVQSILP